MELLDKSQMPWMGVADTAAEEAIEPNARFAKNELPWDEGHENNAPHTPPTEREAINLADYENDYAVATRTFAVDSAKSAVDEHNDSPNAHFDAFSKVYNKIAETRSWVDGKVKPFSYIQEVNEFGQPVNRVNADLTAVVGGVPVEILTMDKAGIVDAPTIRINSRKISALEERVDADESRISTNEGRLANVDERLIQHEQSITGLSSADSVMSDRLDNVDTTLGGIANTLSSHGQSIAALGNDVESAEIKAAAAETMATAAQTASHSAVIATQTFGDDLEQAKARLDNHDVRIRALESGSASGGGARFITRNAAGENFSTKAELDGAAVYYHFGETCTLLPNDYAAVIAD